MSKTVTKCAFASSLIVLFIVCWHAVNAQLVKYKLDTAWPKDSSHFSAPIFSVAVNQFTGDVYVAKRNVKNSNILHFTADGDFVRSLPIEENSLEQVHGLTFHADGEKKLSLWATDVGNGTYGYTVKQYGLDGALLRVLGTPGIPGSSLEPLQFGNVAEVAFGRTTGQLYVVDGDGGLNNRLVKLYSTGYREQWSIGKNGTGRHDFRIPHSVAVSPTTGLVWVADRMNSRLQVFRPDKPQLVATCKMEGGQPYSVRFSSDASHVIVAQLNDDAVAFVSADVAQSTSRCKILGSVELSPGSKPHLVDVDLTSGAFYVGDIGTPGCLRFVPV